MKSGNLFVRKSKHFKKEQLSFNNLIGSPLVYRKNTILGLKLQMRIQVTNKMVAKRVHLLPFLFQL